MPSIRQIANWVKTWNLHRMGDYLDCQKENQWHPSNWILVGYTVSSQNSYWDVAKLCNKLPLNLIFMTHKRLGLHTDLLNVWLPIIFLTILCPNKCSLQQQKIEKNFYKKNEKWHRNRVRLSGIIWAKGFAYYSTFMTIRPWCVQDTYAWKSQNIHLQSKFRQTALLEKRARVHTLMVHQTNHSAIFLLFCVLFGSLFYVCLAL